MKELPSRQTTPAGAEMGDREVNKPRKRWVEADRDELGDMRPQFTPGLLVSQGRETASPHRLKLYCDSSPLELMSFFHKTKDRFMSPYTKTS
jgi:hypothetical protein